MRTTYIYNNIDGIHETKDKAIAFVGAEEPIIVKLVDDEGRYFLSVINPLLAHKGE